MKHPGIILELPDGRKCIAFNKQPLLPSQGKVMLHLTDEKNNVLTDDAGKPRIIMKSVAQYNLENEQGVNKVLGFVD